MHSWRVLLLPYLGYEGLYKRYRFDEPWNGPNNKLLENEMPEEFRSQFLSRTSTITQYVGVSGQGAFWRGTAQLRQDDVQHGFLNPLICLIEAANSDIDWMEPRDIALDQALEGINARSGGGVDSNYCDGLPAQMLSLGCEWISPNLSRDGLRAILTVNKENASEKARREEKVAGHEKVP
jgi:hypothetical protein